MAHRRLLRPPNRPPAVRRGAALLHPGNLLYRPAALWRLPLVIWCWGILALWNLNAFVGNWSEWTLNNQVTLGHGFSRQLLMSDAHTWLFYLTQIANFLLLPPAFYLFYRGLKVLAREPRPEGPGTEAP